MPWDQTAAKRLGDAVRSRRLALNLTQDALAVAAGITTTQLQLIEAGRASSRRGDTGPSNPRMVTVFGLADALGLTVAELIGG